MAALFLCCVQGQLSPCGCEHSLAALSSLSEACSCHQSKDCVFMVTDLKFLGLQTSVIASENEMIKIMALTISNVVHETIKDSDCPFF